MIILQKQNKKDLLDFTKYIFNSGLINNFGPSTTEFD